MDNRFARIIGVALQDVRLEKSKKKVDVAISSGIPAPQLSDIENGKVVPTYATVFKICEALEIEPEVFYFKAFSERNIVDAKKRKYISEYEEQLDNPFQMDKVLTDNDPKKPN
jgi:transcriptional regulator with XRE-family HTH domain